MVGKDESVLDSEPSKLIAERVRSRRGFLKWGIVGGLAVCPVAVAVYRKGAKVRQCVVEVPNQFELGKNYRVAPEQLGVQRFCGPIEIFVITSLVETCVQPYCFGITYSFWGDECPHKRSQIDIEALDKSGNVIASNNALVEDPRIRRKRFGDWQEGDPPFNLWDRVDLEIEGKNVLLAIDRFRISSKAFEI
jgi:hypothetical protein